MRWIYLLTLGLCLSGELFAAPATPPSNDYPVFVAKVPNPHDYNLFATNGWDGNWYVGYNTCWIKKLPAPPKGDYARAFIGAKLGRMKLLTNPKNAWDKTPVPGSVSIAIASTATWTKEQQFQLTRTEEIPFEGDYESAVEGTGEAQWFWTEVPVQAINFLGDNYIALWSPTPELMSISSAPVLAAAWGGKDTDAWLLRDIAGNPPKTSTLQQSGMMAYFQPAIAIKLIPRGPTHPIQVQVVGWTPGTADRPKPVVTARVSGDSIAAVWLEQADGRQNWKRIGRPLRKTPFILSVDPTQLSPGRQQLRVAARNIWQETSASTSFSIEVSTATIKTPY
jgi:hypothetical protein